MADRRLWPARISPEFSSPVSEFLALAARLDVQIALAVVMIAGMVRGFAGFGTGLIYVPVAAALFGPKMAAATLLLYDLPAVIPYTIRLLPKANLREVLPLAFGAALATPIGAFALGALDPEVLRWAISLTVLVAVAAIASGLRFRGEPGRATAIGIGGAAGFLNGLAQIGGPPVILYWLSRSIPAATVRASASLFFLVGSTVTVLTYLANGFLTTEVLRLALLMVPVFALGIVLGAYGFRFAGEATYRRLAYGLITVAAVAGLPVWTS